MVFCFSQKIYFLKVRDGWDSIHQSIVSEEINQSVSYLGFLNGPNPASFCLILFFSHDKYSTNTINEESVDGVLGTRTRVGRIEGANEFTELWRHPLQIVLSKIVSTFMSSNLDVYM